MNKIRITETRKKILVFWYQYNQETNLWPSIAEAEEGLKICYSTIKANIKILEKAGWMISKYRGQQTGLSKIGQASLYNKEQIALGKIKKEITQSARFSNIIKKKQNG